MDFEKIYLGGVKVVVGPHVVHAERDGEMITNANVDYYYAQGGYGCTSPEAVADQFFANFCAEPTMEHKTIKLYQEPCDCGSHIRHNNGGNYHEIVNVHTFTDGGSWCVVLETTSTREDFPGDEYDALLPPVNQYFELFPVTALDRDASVLARFRRGEAEIVRDG